MSSSKPKAWAPYRRHRRGVSFSDERGYSRLVKHWEYVPLGAGEGDWSRYDEPGRKAIEIPLCRRYHRRARHQAVELSRRSIGCGLQRHVAGYHHH